MIEKPPEILEEVKSELENSNLSESKKIIILEKVKLSDDYGKKAYSKIEELEKRIQDLETNLSLIVEENRNLKSELEYYKNIERKLITGIVFLTVFFSIMGIASLAWKFRKFIGIPL